MQNTSQNKDEDIVDDDSDASLDDPAGIIFKIKLKSRKKMGSPPD